nr:MAG TPA: NADPH-dependent 7-cyano-7-deazaguanine reductase [Caudoviricetes sp.]
MLNTRGKSQTRLYVFVYYCNNSVNCDFNFITNSISTSSTFIVESKDINVFLKSFFNLRLFK